MREKRTVERETNNAAGSARTARAAVLQADPAVAALLAGHREAQRRAAEIAASLGHVGATGIPHVHRFWDTVVHEFKPTDLPAAAAWAAAVAALLADPDAPLPGDAAASQPPPNAA